MTNAKRETNQKRMDALRRRAEAAMPDWNISVVGSKVALTAADGPDCETVAILCDDANLDNRDFLTHLPGDHLFLLDQFDKSRELNRTLLGTAAKTVAPAGKDRTQSNAQQCGRLCGDKAFQKFLSSQHGKDAADAERTAVAIRELLDVTSRTELDTDDAAATRWRDFVVTFKNWMRDL